MLLRSLASAFLMYSRIPMPKVEWREENRRYALCFFPLIGLVIGALLFLWDCICGLLFIKGMIRGAVALMLPVLVTGGIHIDGFCDTVDALSSYSGKSRSLEIMKDPHIGSFAVIALCSMMLLQFALLCEINNYAAVAVSFVLSRSISGLAAVTMKNARSGGSLQSFSRPAHKQITVTVLSVTAVLCALAEISTGLMTGVFVCAAAALCLVYYRFTAYRRFGGITGDTEGWFLQITETAILTAVYITEVLAI